MDKSILTVTLNPSLDRTIILDDFKIGQECFLKKEYWSAGGKGLNVARVLKIFGLPVIATGIFCGADGKRIAQLAREEKLKSDFLCIARGSSRAHLTIIDKHSHQTTRVLSLGPRVSAKDLMAFKKKYKELIRKSSFVVLSGRSAYGAPDSYYGDLISLAHKEHLSCALDANGKSLLEAIKYKPLVIKPNLQEAQDVLKEKIKTVAQMKRAIHFFHSHGVRIVLLSLADKGVIGSNQKEMWYVSPKRIKVCQTVGCGDAFLAGFLCYYMKKRTFQESLCFATATASVTACDYQPGKINFKKHQQIFQRLKVKNIL
ncbi:MAG TPA: 1-phosphofructokinase family hexose kinase [Candidatus Omnitrophota bacterium]|nr:1-phosphofructokinase family hexose kinase [Candidatus Omnitrophota bacterium]HPN88440.1 1-phosphofructokinase family hexose kinase [Candidatus Omnitrophota bacterium]